MRSDYWNVTNDQVLDRTGYPLDYWRTILDSLGADELKSGDVVTHLQTMHALPRYWARTLVTWYAKTRIS